MLNEYKFQETVVPDNENETDTEDMIFENVALADVQHRIFEIAAAE